MTVDGLTVAEGCLNLLLHLAVAVKHTGVVHHLSQETDLRAGHQRLDVVCIDRGTAGLYLAADGRHAAGGAEAEIEVYLMSRTNHVVDTLNAQHVTDLVRVGHHTDGAVADGDTRKLARHHHTTLYVYVTIDEAWHQIRPGLLLFWQRASFHLSNPPILDDQFAVEYISAHYVNNMSFYAFHRPLNYSLFTF